MLFSYETLDHEMHLKSITSLVMMVLLLGVSTSALQNSVFAQTSSTSDSDSDITKRLGEIPKDKFKQEAKDKFKQEAKDKFKQEAKDKFKQEAKDKFKQEAREDLRHETQRPNCNQEDSDHARQELSTIEQRYGGLKEKYYQEWQRMHESGEYDGSWATFVKEHFMNSPEIANLNQMREKYHQFMMRCSNAQQKVTEQDNYEEETTSDDDLTDEFEDDIALDDDTTDDLDEETTLDDDLDELLTEIESISVPESIKDDAAWWADNQIEDSEFASSIEYLTSQNVMELAPPGPDSSSHIPAWVKAIAAWWAEGKIPDNEFVNAVRFLVDHGIIKV